MGVVRRSAETVVLLTDLGLPWEAESRNCGPGCGGPGRGGGM